MRNRDYEQKYYQKYKEKILAKVKIYQSSLQAKIKRYAWQKKYRKTLIGKAKRILLNIKCRCYNQKNKYYKYYGGRGIVNYLTEQDILFLLQRDHFELMKKPSIDRINNNGNYTLENCQIIELTENTRKMIRRRSKK
jgi:hypothetical protein